jgi:acyl-CoA synthetase (AMP-forming)/AMP-acid ligase II
MTSLAPPPLVFRGKRWSSDELAGMALAWLDAFGAEFRAGQAPTAMVLSNHPGAVALFFALSSLPVPLIIVPPDFASWRTSPPLPAGARLVLLPDLQAHRAGAEQAGLTVTNLPEPSASSSVRDDHRFLTAPALVLFTSGSTDLPRPVCRPLRPLIDGASALAAALKFPRGRGIICSLPLGRSHGMTHALLMAAAVGCPLALLDRFDHNAVLALFASGEYHYWPATPVMADLLSRCPLRVPTTAPAMCVFPGRLTPHVCRAFQSRFGVPLRQLYAATELGGVTLNAEPAPQVRSDTAGRPLPGVRVCIGDHPAAPFPPGKPGRIWAMTPWWMDGYGVPPHLVPRESVEGWWPTPDIGCIDEAGYLSVTGRLDDCFKTAAGHLVNSALVAAALESRPGVTEAIVVPLDTATGPVLGVLLEGTAPLDTFELRGHLARSLPAWSQPRVLENVAALPRLASGRVDRRACIEILTRSLSQDGST